MVKDRYQRNCLPMEGSADQGRELDELKKFLSERYETIIGNVKQKNFELPKQNLELRDCLCSCVTPNVRCGVLQ